MEWISVKNKLPEIPKELINKGFNRVAVLITNTDIDMAVMAWYEVESEIFYDTFDCFGKPINDVIAWQPLPAPYKDVQL